MCYDEGALQAYLDRELPGRKRWEIEAHIATCDGCRGALASLEEANAVATAQLSAVARDLSKMDVSTEAAWTRLTRDERFGAPAVTKGVIGMLRDRLKILVPVAAVAVIAASFGLAPVREATAGFLKVFRVQKVQTITIAPEDIEEMRRLGESKVSEVDIENLGKFETSGTTRPEAASLDEAKKAVDFELALPAAVAGYGAPSYSVKGSSTSSFTLDVDQANNVIESFGGTTLLPASLDGKTFTAKMPTAVIASYPSEGGALMVTQARSPELVLPEDVDPVVVRDALLDLPILPKNIKAQLESVTDWRQTLIVPSINGSSQEVTVNGQEGVFVTPPPKDAVSDPAKFSKRTGHAGNVLVWQKDGVIHGIAGQLTLEQALDIAAMMK